MNVVGGKDRNSTEQPPTVSVIVTDNIGFTANKPDTSVSADARNMTVKAIPDTTN